MPALHVAPEALIAAAIELDALAARLQASMALSSPATHIIPSGSEEVSWHVASYFNGVAETFGPAVAQGILEMQETAATLRSQAAIYAAQDMAGGAALSAIM